jgi:uncharacterized membrane protein YbhN (UPF0104 family)
MRITLGWLIVGLVVFAAYVTVHNSILAAGNALTNIPPLALSVLILPGALMMAATGISFSLLVLPKDSGLTQRSTIVCIYLTAQVIKYLPGRIWGLAYQLKQLSQQVHARQGIVASVNHMILTALISVLFMGVAFDVTGAWPLALCGVLLGLIWAQRGGIAPYLTWRTKTTKLGPAKLPNKAVLGIGISILLEWLFYLIVWGDLFLLLQMPVEKGSVIAAAGLYAGAWILGSLASLTPGGLGIREGGFVMAGLGLGIPESNLVTLAILARLVFTLAEILAGALAAVYLHKTAK